MLRRTLAIAALAATAFGAQGWMGRQYLHFKEELVTVEYTGSANEANLIF